MYLNRRSNRSKKKGGRSKIWRVRSKKWGENGTKWLCTGLKGQRKGVKQGIGAPFRPLFWTLECKGDEIPHIFDPCGAPYFWLMGAPYIWPVVTFRPIFLTYKGSSPLWHKKISTKIT